MKNIMITAALLFFATVGHAQNASELEVKKLSNDWMLAAMNRDEKTLNKIVAPEFILAGTNIDNPGVSREVWMKNTLENLKIDSVNYLKMKVVIIENVAIVQSTFYWSAAFGNMPAKKDTVNMVDTWIKRKQGWQVVSRLIAD